MIFVFCIGKAPPGRLSIQQPGNDCGLKQLLKRVCREIVLSQNAHGKQLGCIVTLGSNCVGIISAHFNFLGSMI